MRRTQISANKKSRRIIAAVTAAAFISTQLCWADYSCLRPSAAARDAAVAASLEREIKGGRADTAPWPSSPAEVAAEFDKATNSRWYGRTLRIEKGDEVWAVKFLKKGEGQDVLEEEAQRMRELRSKGIMVPVPIQLGENGKDFVFTYEGALTKVTPEVDESHQAIMYVAAKEYFTYPEDIKDSAAMAQLARNSMRQLAQLLKAGYIHESLSPLTHETRTDRFWEWDRVPLGGIESYVQGGLEEKLSYSNIRLCGIADFAHVKKINADTLLAHKIGQQLCEWAITSAYHLLKIGLSPEITTQVLREGFRAFLQEMNAEENVGFSEELSTFVRLFEMDIHSEDPSRDTRSFEISSQDDGDRPTLDNLVKFVKGIITLVGSPQKYAESKLKRLKPMMTQNVYPDYDALKWGKTYDGVSLSSPEDGRIAVDISKGCVGRTAALAKLVGEALELLDEKINGTNDAALKRLWGEIKEENFLGNRPVNIRVARDIGVNSAKYVKKSSAPEIILALDFVETLLRDYEAHTDVAAWLLAERLFHELGHNDKVSSENDARSEEAVQIEIDVDLYKEVVGKDEGLKNAIDGYFKRAGDEKPKFRSGGYFQLLREAAQLSDNLEISKKISEFLDRNYRFSATSGGVIKPMPMAAPPTLSPRKGSEAADHGAIIKGIDREEVERHIAEQGSAVDRARLEKEEVLARIESATGDKAVKEKSVQLRGIANTLKCSLGHIQDKVGRARGDVLNSKKALKQFPAIVKDRSHYALGIATREYLGYSEELLSALPPDLKAEYVFYEALCFYFCKDYDFDRGHQIAREITKVLFPENYEGVSPIEGDANPELTGKLTLEIRKIIAAPSVANPADIERERINPNSPRFDIEAWCIKHFLPAYGEIVTKGVNNQLIGADISNFIDTVILPLKRDFDTKVVIAPDEKVKSWQYNAFLEELQLQILIPHNFVLFGHNTRTLGRIEKTEIVDSPAGNRVPVYTVSVLVGEDIGEGGAWASSIFVVITRGLEQRFEDNVRNAKEGWRKHQRGQLRNGEKIVSLEEHPECYLDVVGTCVLGRMGNGPAKGLLREQALVEELAHYDAFVFTKALAGRVDFIETANAILRPETELRRKLNGIQDEDEKENYAHGIIEVEGKLSRLVHSPFIAYSLCDSLIGVILPKPADYNAPDEYRIANEIITDALNAELADSPELSRRFGFKNGQVDKKAWLKFLNTFVGNAGGVNNELSRAAEAAYKKLFLTLTERKALLDTRRDAKSPSFGPGAMSVDEPPASLPPRPPNGSPYGICKILREQFHGRFVSPEDIQPLTKGRPANRNLAVGTIDDDLRILWHLGLAEKKVEWEEVKDKIRKKEKISYKLVGLTPWQWEIAERILQGLGRAPSVKEARAARDELSSALRHSTDKNPDDAGAKRVAAIVGDESVNTALDFVAAAQEPANLEIVLQELGKREDVREQFLPAMMRAFDNSANSPEIRRKIIDYAKKFFGVEAVELFRKAAADSDILVRSDGIWKLAKLGDADSLPVFVAALKDDYPSVRWNGIRGLGKLKHGPAVNQIIDLLLNDPEEVVREEAALALGEIGDTSVIPTLEELLREKTAYGRITTLIVDIRSALKKLKQAKRPSGQKLKTMLTQHIYPDYDALKWNRACEGVTLSSADDGKIVASVSKGCTAKAAMFKGLIGAALELLDEKIEGTKDDRLKRLWGEIKEENFLGNRPVNIRVARDLGVNSAKYVKEGNAPEIILALDLVETLLRDYDAHTDVVVWLLAERLFHELGHDNKVGALEDELPEETRQIKRDAELYKKVVLADPPFAEKVDEYFKSQRPEFPSGKYFELLKRVVKFGENEAAAGAQRMEIGRYLSPLPANVRGLINHPIVEKLRNGVAPGKGLLKPMPTGAPAPTSGAGRVGEIIIKVLDRSVSERIQETLKSHFAATAIYNEGNRVTEVVISRSMPGSSEIEFRFILKNKMEKVVVCQLTKKDDPAVYLPRLDTLFKESSERKPETTFARREFLKGAVIGAGAIAATAAVGYEAIKFISPEPKVTGIYAMHDDANDATEAAEIIRRLLIGVETVIVMEFGGPAFSDVFQAPDVKDSGLTPQVFYSGRASREGLNIFKSEYKRLQKEGIQTMRRAFFERNTKSLAPSIREAVDLLIERKNNIKALHVECDEAYSDEEAEEFFQANFEIEKSQYLRDNILSLMMSKMVAPEDYLFVAKEAAVLYTKGQRSRDELFTRMLSRMCEKYPGKILFLRGVGHYDWGIIKRRLGGRVREEPVKKPRFKPLEEVYGMVMKGASIDNVKVEELLYREIVFDYLLEAFRRFDVRAPRYATARDAAFRISSKATKEDAIELFKLLPEFDRKEKLGTPVYRSLLDWLLKRRPEIKEDAALLIGMVNEFLTPPVETVAAESRGADAVKLIEESLALLSSADKSKENSALRRIIYGLRRLRKEGLYPRELFGRVTSAITAGPITDHLLYKETRTELMKWRFYADEPIRNLADGAIALLRKNLLERFLGPNEARAVDKATERAYGWADVVVFPKNIDTRHKELIVGAIENTPLVKETIFLMYGEKVDLHDIALEGVEVYKQGEGSNKVVYGVRVRTRKFRNYEFAINTYNPAIWLGKMNDLLQRISAASQEAQVSYAKKYLGIVRATGFLLLAFPEAYRALGDGPVDIQGAKIERAGDKTWRINIRVKDRWHRLDLNEAAFLRGDVGSEAAALIEGGTMEITGEGEEYPGRLTKVVEDFGGLYENYSMWTEEFIGSGKIEQLMWQREGEPYHSWQRRLTETSPDIARRAIAAYFDLYNRVNWRWVISEPLPQNVLVPETDYMTDARVIDVGDRAPFKSYRQTIEDMNSWFLDTHQSCARPVLGASYRLSNEIIFCAFLDSILNAKAGDMAGDGALKYGTSILEGIRRELKEEAEREIAKSPQSRAAEAAFRRVILGQDNSADSRMLRDLGNFLSNGIKDYHPWQVAFAKRSYDKGLSENRDASYDTREAMAVYFYQVYGINRLAEYYPWWETVYFSETCYAGCPQRLQDAFSDLVKLQKSEQYDYRNKSKTDKDMLLLQLMVKHKLDEKDSYYLMQMVAKEVIPESGTEGLPAGGTVERDERDAAMPVRPTTKAIADFYVRGNALYQAHISRDAFRSLNKKEIVNEDGTTYLIRARVSNFGGGWRLLVCDAEGNPTDAFMEGVFSRQLNRILITDVNLSSLKGKGIYAGLYRLLSDISPPGLEISSIIVPDRSLYPQSARDAVRDTIVGQARSEAGFAEHEIIGSSFISRKPRLEPELFTELKNFYRYKIHRGPRTKTARRNPITHVRIVESLGQETRRRGGILEVDKDFLLKRVRKVNEDYSAHLKALIEPRLSALTPVRHPDEDAPAYEAAAPHLTDFSGIKIWDGREELSQLIRDSDVVIFGEPDDKGISRNLGRAGASAAPTAVMGALIEELKGGAPLHPPLIFPIKPTVTSVKDVTGHAPSCKTLYIGDLKVKESVDGTYSRAEIVVKRLLEINPAVTIAAIGGDHGFSHFNSSQFKGRKAKVIAGAHLNARRPDDVKSGRAVGPNSGTSVFLDLTQGGIEAGGLVYLGVNPETELFDTMMAFLRERGLPKENIYFLKDILDNKGEDGVGTILKEAFAKAERISPDVICASACIDAVDKKGAPGRSARNIVGVPASVILEFARYAGAHPKVKLFELDEISPPLDEEGRTVKLGAKILMEFLAGFASRSASREDGASKQPSAPDGMLDAGAPKTEGGAVRGKGGALEMKENEVVSEAIKGLLVGGGQRYQVSQKSLTALDAYCGGLLSEGRVTIYRIPGLRRKIIEIARKKGVEAPIDLLSHPGRGGEEFGHSVRNLYIDEEDYRLLMIVGEIEPKAAWAWAKHEVYHLDHPDEKEPEVEMARPTDTIRAVIKQLRENMLSSWQRRNGLEGKITRVDRGSKEKINLLANERVAIALGKTLIEVGFDGDKDSHFVVRIDLDGQELGKRKYFNGNIILGRDSGSDLFKMGDYVSSAHIDSWVSRGHLSITASGRVIEVEDLGSSNGSWVCSGSPAFVMPPAVDYEGLIAEADKYVSENVVENKDVILANLHNPMLRDHLVAAREKNVLLLVAHEINWEDLAERQLFRDYLDVVQRCINRIPSDILKKSSTPLILEVPKGEGALGIESIKAAAPSVSHGINGIRSMEASTLISVKRAGISGVGNWNEKEIEGAIVEELINRQLAAPILGDAAEASSAPPWWEAAKSNTPVDAMNELAALGCRIIHDVSESVPGECFVIEMDADILPQGENFEKTVLALENIGLELKSKGYGNIHFRFFSSSNNTKLLAKVWEIDTSAKEKELERPLPDGVEIKEKNRAAIVNSALFERVKCARKIPAIPAGENEVLPLSGLVFLGFSSSAVTDEEIKTKSGNYEAVKSLYEKLLGHVVTDEGLQALMCGSAGSITEFVIPSIGTSQTGEAEQIYKDMIAVFSQL